MSTTLIRRATLNDAQALADFNQNMAWETESIRLIPSVILAGVTRMISDENLGFYLVVENLEASEIVASLMITTEWSDWRNGVFWWIQSVYVKPEWRRKGLYRALYQNAKSMAENEDSVCGFRLYVERENTVAQSVYASLGMQETHYQMYEELKDNTIFCEPSSVEPGDEITIS